jgi:tRNA (uracil-5-)-methyltransferase TRM9
MEDSVNPLKSTLKAYNKMMASSNADFPDESVVRFVRRKFGGYPTSKKNLIKALDIGFGTGRHIIYLLSEGFDVYGIDYAESSLRATQGKISQMGLSASLAIGEFGQASIPPDAYDLIIAWGVLFNKPEPDIHSDIKKIYDILKPGGTLIADFRTLNNWFYGKGKKMGQHAYLLDETAGPYKGLFYRFMAEKEVVSFFEKTHFTIELLEYKEWLKFGKELHSWWMVQASKV